MITQTTFACSNIECKSSASDFSERDVLITQTTFVCSNIDCESSASDFSEMMSRSLK
jgi:hypothetical protein